MEHQARAAPQPRCNPGFSRRTMTSTSTQSGTTAPRLRRVLTLWDLVFYGIVLVQPIAPVPLYGVAQKLSDGHFVTIILIALLAMLITAVTYGPLAPPFPTPGSTFTLFWQRLHPHPGFLPPSPP